MRFTSLTVLLMVAVSVSSRAIPRDNTRRGFSLSKIISELEGKDSSSSSSSVPADLSGASNSTSVDSDDSGASNSTSIDSSDLGSNSTSIDSASASNSTSSDDTSDDTGDESDDDDDDESDDESDDDSSDSATSTSTATDATRTRPCDQGDQSLAAGLNAAVVIGLGMQASVLTLQNSTDANDFATGVTRLQQFLSTMDLQIQMAQNIADDDSFAQPQLGVLASSQTAQTDAVSGLNNGTTAQDAATANTLTQLLSSFLNTTDTAQDGASNALIDCFLPTTTLSG